MPANLPELGVLRVAKPCQRDWSKMTGDDRTRFCTDCKLNVYDLSAMTTEEARELIREKEGGELCVRFYQRADGTVLTKDCPVGVVRRKRTVLAAAGAALASLTGLAAFAFTAAEPPPPLMAEPLEGASCDRAVAPAAEPKKNDESWMEKRRNALGAREKSRATHTMGAIQVIRTAK